jgi:putative lipoprotein
MRSIALLLLTTTSLALVTTVPTIAGAQATDPDPWWGRDKALHFTVAGAIAGIGYGIGTEIFDRRWQCAAFGGGLALVAGAGKELLDMTGFGDPSWKDFTWDVIGAVAGLGVAIAIDALVRPRDASSSSSSTSGARLSSPFVVRF